MSASGCGIVHPPADTPRTDTPSGQTPPGQTPPQAHTSLDRHNRQTPPRIEVTIEAGGTHPTGIHSCLLHFLSKTA